MKLYTEEQVKESFYNGVKYASGIHPASIGWINQYVEGIINSLTPIELPSDEEIEEQAIEITSFTSGTAKTICESYYQSGAKWIKQQILNQNKS